MFGPHRIFTFLIEKTESIWYCSVYDVNFPHGRKKSNALFKKKTKKGREKKKKKKQKQSRTSCFVAVSLLQLH